ncbi:MAG: hypothetical protein JJU29_02365 [Verrucomicrobia bacterium]|nr:hypothetical protein [Verrucomicrobiota bacterium]MCH8511181.1 hypothetical protein [Kiritimatiellia bacterium]
MTWLIPKFNLQRESTAVLRVGWVFFFLISLLFLSGAWFELNPRPRESPEEIRQRLREESRQIMREHGFAGSLPDLPPIETPEPPAPSVNHSKVFQAMTLSLGMFFLVWVPIHKELRGRKRNDSGLI